MFVSFWASSAQVRKQKYEQFLYSLVQSQEVFVNFFMSVCLSVSTYKRRSHWIDFRVL